ncbi:MAG TPA: hypothetical protein VGJ28_00380, partial [Micromonosporaceae bacterium]
MDKRGRTALLVAAGTALLLGIAYLLAPKMGTDLSAQVARANFFRAHGFRPIDFRWYGGVNQLGYSLTTPALMSVIGSRVLGVVASVIFAPAATYVLLRTNAPRPVLGGALFGIMAVGNIASGRITFAAGLAFATLAVAVVLSPAARVPRLIAVGALAVLTTVTSPIAGLFLGLAAAAWLLADAVWADRRFRRGPEFSTTLVMGGCAAVGLIPMQIFSDGGTEPFSAAQMRYNVAITLAVILIVPAYRVIRIAAVLTLALLFFALYVPTAIGSNSIRLPMLFAFPIIVAYSQWRNWAIVLALMGIWWWQAPIVVGDITQAGSPETKAAFYQPLLGELSTLGTLGRIEVVPLRDHWESSYVADEVPLARGWLRQVDTDRNPLFYTSKPVTAAQYGDWLRANAVQYVAYAPDQPLDVYARTEAAVVSAHPSYLREVWHSAQWQLFQVTDPEPFVTGGTLVSVGATAVTFDTAA